MLGSVNFLAILKDSATLAVLAACSLVSITFAIERFFYFRKAKGSSDEVLGHVHKLLEGGKTDQAAAYCQKRGSAVSQVVHYGLLHAGRPRKDLDELLGTKRLEEKLKLEKNLAVLGTLGNISPFIGLLGTVIGIIKAFQDLAAAGGGGPSVVAKGIAEALVATAGGLLVAIPAVIFYNIFMRKVKTLGVEMEVASTRLMVMLGTK
jgi:biopolymer transport protein ExbB